MSLHTGIYEPRKQWRLIGGLEASAKKHGTWDLNLRGKPSRFGRTLAEVIPKGSKVIDIGAGIGRHVKVLQDYGFDVIGLDGTFGIEKISKGWVKQVDLTVTEECRPYFKAADWGIFWGVGEHVPRELEQVLIDNVTNIPTRGLILSWAAPGVRGKGHINCRKFDYVINEFTRYGWIPDQERTKKILASFGRRKPTGVVLVK